jgi:hypothetical protein
VNCTHSVSASARNTVDAVIIVSMMYAYMVIDNEVEVAACAIHHSHVQHSNLTWLRDASECGREVDAMQ